MRKGNNMLILCLTFLSLFLSVVRKALSFLSQAIVGSS